MEGVDVTLTYLYSDIVTLENYKIFQFVIFARGGRCPDIDSEKNHQKHGFDQSHLWPQL
jgi:hypothetical protein